MPLTRRSLITGVAAATVAISGCSNNTDDDVNVPDPSDGNEGPSSQNGSDSQTITSFHHVFKPKFGPFEEIETEDGNLALEVELQNIDQNAVEGRLRADFEFDYNETASYNSTFTLPGGEVKTVRATYPIPYDRWQNVTGLELTVPSINETGK